MKKFNIELSGSNGKIQNGNIYKKRVSSFISPKKIMFFDKEKIKLTNPDDSFSAKNNKYSKINSIHDINRNIFSNIIIDNEESPFFISQKDNIEDQSDLVNKNKEEKSKKEIKKENEVGLKSKDSKGIKLVRFDSKQLNNNNKKENNNLNERPLMKVMTIIIIVGINLQ